MSENLPIVPAELTSSEEDSGNSKSKKKKKAIGVFAVEGEPSKPFSKFWGKDKKPESATDSAKAEKPAENIEALNPDEKSEVVSQLAAARKQELQTEAGTEPIDPAETEAVEAYLASVQAEGDIDAAYTSVVSQLENSDSPEPESSPPELSSPAELNPLINSTASQETEITLGPDPTPPTESMPAPLPTAAGGNLPPRPPEDLPPVIFDEGPSGPDRPEVPPVSTAETVIPLTAAIRSERQARTEGLVVGGIVGYLVGRRRGRIKTEKRLAPIQKKLEKQVKALQSELIVSESLVRQKVKERWIPPAVTRSETSANQAPIRRSVAERSPSPVIVPPERIGHVVMIANANRETPRAPKPVRPDIVTARKQAESLSRDELLSISETITVEGTSLRKVYETQLVSEKGLRRLVAEHLRGGNITRALQTEIVEHEIDFERDPILRDKAHASGSDAAGKAALAAMLVSAGVSTADESQTIGPTPRDNPAAATKQSADQPASQTSLVDASLVTLISLLTLAIIAILLRG